MRWEQLFADLEAQFDELAEAELQAELAERQRIEYGSITLVARLAGSMGEPLRLRTVAGVGVTGILRRLGPDWALVDESPGRQSVVALAAVTVVDGLGRAAGPPPTGIAARLTLRAALRGVARDRSPVSVTVPGSAGPDSGSATELTGTIDRVGADFVELAEHAPWEPRRSGTVRRVAVIPLENVAVVRAQPLG